VRRATRSCPAAVGGLMIMPAREGGCGHYKQAHISNDSSMQRCCAHCHTTPSDALVPYTNTQTNSPGRTCWAVKVDLRPVGPVEQPQGARGSGQHKHARHAVIPHHLAAAAAVAVAAAAAVSQQHHINRSVSSSEVCGRYGASNRHT
jgi:hypothetical protein